jgi:hypothetical protein
MATRPARPRPAQAQAAKPQSAKTPPPKAAPAKAQSPKAQSAEPQPAKPQSPKAQSAKPQPAKPQSPKAQSAKPQPAKPQSPKAQQAKAKPAKSPAAKPQPAKTQPAKTQPAEPQPAGPVAAPPRALRVAAVLEGVEAVGMLVAAGFAAVATAAGKSYELSSGIALTLIAVATAALFAAFAVGLARSRPWTRTPVVMFQLAIGFWGVFLLTGHKYAWGVPMLVLAAAILACVFTPAALRALNRPPRPS